MTGYLVSSAPPDLVCLHAAGATGAMFAGIADRLKGLANVVTPELPGRGATYDQKPLLRMETAVASLLPGLLTRPDRSYALFGYSMGALVAFELTCELALLGAGLPAVLFVAATRAPHVPPREAPLHLMDDADLLEELARFQGTAQELLDDAELMDLVLPRLRADFELCETYRFGQMRQLPVPLYAFGGKSDEKVTAADLAAWLQLTLVGGTWEQLPGGHFFLENHEEALTRRIASIMLPGAYAVTAPSGTVPHG